MISIFNFLICSLFGCDYKLVKVLRFYTGEPIEVKACTRCHRTDHDSVIYY